MNEKLFDEMVNDINNETGLSTKTTWSGGWTMNTQEIKECWLMNEDEFSELRMRDEWVNGMNEIVQRWWMMNSVNELIGSKCVW